MSGWNLRAGTGLALAFGVSLCGATSSAAGTTWYQGIVPTSRLGVYQHGTYPSEKSTKNPGTYLTHVGADLAAPCGTPVYAWAGGQVVDAISAEGATNHNSLGYMVMIDHGTDQVTGKRVYSTYFHLDSPPLVSSGRVEAGTQIGVVGDTGYAFGCHLHFEVRHFRDRFNPAWGNIYGPGDQRQSSVFLAGWSDPATYPVANLSGGARPKSSPAPTPAPTPAVTPRAPRVQPAPTPVVGIPRVPGSLTPGRSREPGPSLAGSSVTIMWGSARGASEYRLTVRNMNTRKNVATERLPGNYFSLRVRSGHTYRWSVRACNDAGCSEGSQDRFFTAQ